ncbi:hypothetical protein [Streptomyces sp. NBC_00566]|uniref:hypothetical protein n=1 Tax=Streptomyces sp. NBC_00566 TaxID=2975778 RepID=UPI002E80EF0A|nr:hypothetical protein [Streptomyces sp. NBC_00566]WUB88222.1 hypothetical protein OG812_17235 [Streptomyces sp. NBC_00566]
MSARQKLYAALMAGGPHSPARSEKATRLIDALLIEAGVQYVTCQTCGAGYEVGQPCQTCAFDARMAEEQSSRPAADAAPGLTERQARLLDAIRTHEGQWTTARALSLYALTDPGVVQRGTARRDLDALHRAGHLVLVDDDPNRKHYLLHRKDVRP